MTDDTKTNAYDAVPYGSFPFAQTSPSANRAIASLFGLNAPSPASAKILELGCASGNNILSIAARFPNAQCVGIDLSATQIEEGNKRVAELGISNLHLEVKSITDITKEFGTFDYIICHGVYSWVSKELQKEILRICSENLSPQGIAYVSYNTLPGWSQIAAMREMMLYHTQRFSDPQHKAEQARLLLKFLLDTSKKQGNNLYSSALEQEANILSMQSDWYLLHDHLEENNLPCYFHEFMATADGYGLQYLSETSLHTMFSDNLPEETAKVLATSDDIVRTEQYMDFISNRRFRCTLLCHKEAKLSRKLNAEMMADKFFTSQFILPQGIENYEIGSGKPLTFQSHSSLALTTDNQLMITALLVLAEQRAKPLHMKKLCQQVIARIKAKGYTQTIDAKELEQLLCTQLLRSIFIGGITLHLDEESHTNIIADKPKVFRLAAYQSARQEWASNLYQHSIPISAFDKAFMPLLDGSRSKEALVEALLPHFARGELTVTKDNKALTEHDEIKSLLPEAIQSVLQSYADRGLLVE